MHRQIDDPNSLEYFYVKNHLLLINNLQSWIKEEPDKPFELILIQHHGAINESHWMDAVANAQHGTNSGLAAIPYPFLPAYGIGEAALSNTAVRLFKQEHCVVLEDGPVIVAGWSQSPKVKAGPDRGGTSLSGSPSRRCSHKPPSVCPLWCQNPDPDNQAPAWSVEQAGSQRVV